MHELREYQRLQLVLFMCGGRPRPPLLTLTNMKREAQFVICIGNKSYPASLESRKIYQIIPDKVAARLHQIRVIDESGEEYLYAEDYFRAGAVAAGGRESRASGHGITGSGARPS